MTNNILPVNFQQNFHVFQKLSFLEDHEELRNIVILDYGSLTGKQHYLNAILKCGFLYFLRNYFHMVILTDNVHHTPNTYGRQNCTVIQVSSHCLRKVKQISDHIAAQIMACFSNGLFQNYRCRRAYYCLSEDKSFPDGLQFIEYTGYEHVYCSVIRSIKDFLDLQNHFKNDMNDPTKMNVAPLLKNNIQRDRTGDNSGKLMFFLHGEMYFGKSVKVLWKDLKNFGDTHCLSVSVTTAFPSVDYEVKIVFV